MSSAPSFDVARVVAAVRALPGSAPVTLVFATGPYAEILANWIYFARRASANRILIIALGDGVDGTARANFIPCLTIRGPMSRSELWVLRARVFAALAHAGIDFIHSDADAVWLRSPVQEAFSLAADIAFSTGTVWPRSALRAWGFVVCCGFFAARGTPLAAAFFSEVAERAKACGDDQVAVNEALLVADIVWNDRTPSVRQSHKGQQFRTFATCVNGLSQESGLRVVLLPHSRFTRLAEISRETLVAHPIAPKTSGVVVEPERLSQVLAGLGLWQLEDQKPRA